MPQHLPKSTFDKCMLPVLANGRETWLQKKGIITNKLQVSQITMEYFMLGLQGEIRKEWNK